MTWQPPNWPTAPKKAAPAVVEAEPAPDDEEIAPGWGRYRDWKERIITMPNGKKHWVLQRMTERQIPSVEEMIEQLLWLESLETQRTKEILTHHVAPT